MSVAVQTESKRQAEIPPPEMSTFIFYDPLLSPGRMPFDLMVDSGTVVVRVWYRRLFRDCAQVVPGSPL